MKFDLHTDTIEKVGDIQSNNISIDVNNLERGFVEHLEDPAIYRCL